MHTTLQPKTNLRLMALSSVVAVVVSFTVSPTPWLLLGVGAAFGTCAGIIELRALRESSESLLIAQTSLDVRRVLSSSHFGRFYLYVFWSSMAVLFALSSYLHRGQALWGLLVGYSTFEFTRQLLTLRAALELRRLSMERG